ncbi:sensor domain-containing diguanylate cyclase [Lichenibacterium dinghuense]|uniref:sensor domain-containing diguanylate cyclase n=1 Tax=Lichenibacterium dinghuense TaxID=2895977 RepID=UPI001F1DD07D|nr:sensor domain-containing diguanylate cyclase [Lichenibacterium sp. 6Y81]
MSGALLVHDGETADGQRNLDVSAMRTVRDHHRSILILDHEASSTFRNDCPLIRQQEDAVPSAPWSPNRVEHSRTADPFESPLMIAVAEIAVPAYVVEHRGAEGYVFAQVNAAAVELWTGRGDAITWPGSLSEAFPEDIAQRIAGSYDLCLRTARTLERDSTVPTPRGDMTIRTTLYPLAKGPDGWPSILGIVTDVTEERRIRDELEQSNARLSLAMEALGGAHWFYDAVRRTFDLGPSFSRLLGARYLPVMSMAEWLDVVHPDDRDDTCFIDLLNGRVAQRTEEFRIVDALGEVRWLRCFRRAVHNGPLVSGIAGVVIDITAEKDREDRLVEQTLTDPLTGLANRRGLEQVLSAAIADAKALTLLMIDVDQFKAYNDSYGHVAGDAVLRRVGSAIDGVMSPLGGLVARYGGEEFVAVVPGLGFTEADRVAGEVLRAVSDLRDPHAASQHGVVTISAGCVTRVAGEPGLDLLTVADAALYRAKSDGRNCFRWARLQGDRCASRTPLRSSAA